MKTQSKVKKWFLAVGIAIIFVMFVNYATNTVFDKPQYDDFCVEKFIQYETEQECVENGGEWNVFAPRAEGKTGNCDVHYTCRQEYDDARDSFEDKAFIVNVIFGLIGLVLGFILTVESVSAGFLLGGVLELFFATVAYWDKFGDVIRVIILGVVLAILIWIGYKKIK